MKRSVLAIVLVLSGSYMFAQGDEVRTKNYNLKKNVALEGYDAVSYFDQHPMEGKEGISFTYLGVNYLFANQANLGRFKTNPGKFEPAYGGWCAYAMGDSGEKVKVDPETYKIIDGKLYLFYNFWGNNTLKDWNKNERPLKTKGDLNWKKFER